MKKSAPKKTESLQVIPKKRAGRRCSICFHIAVKSINEQIRKGVSFRNIASQFEFSYGAVARHTENCLKLDIHALLKEKRINQKVEHYQELIKQLECVKAIQEAVWEQLIDSVTGKITLVSRTNEIEVVFPDFGDLNKHGIPKQKKAKLSDVILSIAKHIQGFEYATYQVKSIDLFDAALKTIDAVDKILDKFARVDGHYQKEPENDEKLTRVAKAFLNWREDHLDMPVEVIPKWLLRFAKNSGVDAKRLADRVGIGIS